MNRKYRSGQATNLWFWHPKKITILGVFFAVFSETADELNMPAKPPNTHRRSHLAAKEPTDLPTWSRRWTISGVQNVTLY